MKNKLHPRIVKLMEFYNRPDNVCDYMNSKHTNFVLIPENYREGNIMMPILNFAKTRDYLALAYVLEKDLLSIEKEGAKGKELFGDLLRILKEDETGEKIDRRNLKKELDFAFSPLSKIHPHLDYKGEGFYMITMGLRYSSRYAVSSHFVITRISDVQAVPNDTKERIRHRSFDRYGGEYDANALLVCPKQR